MKKVCIIILNYLSYQLTIDFIKQLNKLDHSLFDVLVIDNDSPNESANILKLNQEELSYQLICNSDNVGFARGNNVGLMYAYEKGYEYSWIVNNDLIITDELILQKMLSNFESDESICCVGPKIVDLSSIPCAPYPIRPSKWDLTFGIKNYFKVRINSVDKKSTVYRLHGCCMLVDNVKMKKVDFFDERTFLYCEEEILAERLLPFGYKSVYDPNTVITHMESSTVGNSKGSKSKFKRKCVKNSMKIYLRDYRRFNVFVSNLCIFVRNLRIYLKG